jgi:hypothetical protein
MVPPNTFGQSDLKSARAGRASRAGARAGRIIRIVRMIKLYKYFNTNKEKEAAKLRKLERAKKLEALKNNELDVVEFTLEDGAHLDTTDTATKVEDLPPESHVGAAMSDITTRRLNFHVLVYLLISCFSYLLYVLQCHRPYPYNAHHYSHTDLLNIFDRV